MRKPIWKGAISFGLVTIPVEMYSAERTSDLDFDLLDKRDHARIRYKRVNEVTGKEVPWGTIVKGYETKDNVYVILSDKDFKRAAIESSEMLEIGSFVSLAEIETKYFDKPYYLLPARQGEKGYGLLRKALEKSGKTGIATLIMRNRQHLAAVYPEGGVLLLMILRFAHELVSIKDLGVRPDAVRKAKVSKTAAKEIAVAEQLIHSLTTPWNPKDYHDDYREALLQWIRKRAKAGQLEAEP